MSIKFLKNHQTVSEMHLTAVAHWLRYASGIMSQRVTHLSSSTGSGGLALSATTEEKIVFREKFQGKLMRVLVVEGLVFFVWTDCGRGGDLHD